MSDKVAAANRVSGIGMRLCKVAVIALAFASTSAVAAIYPLELVSPRAAGTAPSSDGGTPAIPAGHRIFKAYPGIEYNIRAVVIGGSYPFTYSLSSAPSGMSINSDTGEINWANPQANATPTITVTDAEGTVRSSSWSISVTTSGFRFMDAANGNDASNGSVDSPWRTLGKLQTSGTNADIVYFKNGRYNVADAPNKTEGGTNPWSNAPFAAVKWIAYPGHSPAIDHGYIAGTRLGWNVRLEDHGVYVDGMRSINYGNIGWQPIGNYQVWRGMTTVGPLAGIDGGNPGTVMFRDEGSGGFIAQYAAFQNCDFSGAVGGGHIKTYTLKKFLVEDSQFHDTEQAFDIKQDIQRWEARGNRFVNVRDSGISGNFAQRSVAGGTTGGEVRFNLFKVPSVTNGAIYTGGPPIHIYRNTIVGKVLNTMSAGESINMYANVIVNNSPPPTKSENAWYVSGSPTWDLDGPSSSGSNTNLIGDPSDGIVDANGNLTSAYSGYIGTRGHQLGEPVSPPSPPTDFVVE